MTFLILSYQAVKVLIYYFTCSQVRKAAIKELPNLCKSDSQLILRLTDVLVQVLASEDTSELNMVNSALTSMFKMNVKGEFINI